MKLTRVTVCILSGLSLATASLAANDGLIAWWTFDEVGKAFDHIGQIEDSVKGNISYVEGIAGNCVKADGYTTYVIRQAGDAPQLTDAFSIEAWIAPQTYSWNWTAIVNQEMEHEAGYFFGINYLGQIGLQAAIDGTWHSAVSDKPVELLKWSHIVGTFNSKTGLSVYINGRLEARTDVKGRIRPATDADLLIGKSIKRMYPELTERQASKNILSNMIFDGLIDEVRIYSKQLTAEQIKQQYDKSKPQNIQPLKYRKFPSGPKGPGRFGAYYTRLRYAPEWEALWRVGDYADVLVRFDISPVKMAFWRGANYGPAWITENDIWMADQSLENGGTDGSCCEHMSDKQCRYSHVRIIENTDARIVVHWRYAPCDIKYRLSYVDETGWGDWVDEYYTIYPDCVSTRQQVYWSSYFKQGKAPGWFQFQESLLFNQPGTKPEDNIETEAVTLVNMEGLSHTYSWADRGPATFPEPADATILVHNLKADNKPFIIFESEERIAPFPQGEAMHKEYSSFYCWNHWPVSMLPNEGRETPASDRPSHTGITVASTPIGGGKWKIHSTDQNNCSQLISLYGMSTQHPAQLAKLARSWNYPPTLKVTSNTFKSQSYDKFQRAYILKAAGDTANLQFQLAASDDSPVVNPCFVINNWGDGDARLKINSKEIKHGKEFRFGHRHTLESSDLIVWIKTESTRPIKIELSPVN